MSSDGYEFAERAGTSPDSPVIFLFHGTGGDEHQFVLGTLVRSGHTGQPDGLGKASQEHVAGITHDRDRHFDLQHATLVRRAIQPWRQQKPLRSGVRIEHLLRFGKSDPPRDEGDLTASLGGFDDRAAYRVVES